MHSLTIVLKLKTLSFILPVTINVWSIVHPGILVINIITAKNLVISIVMSTSVRHQRGNKFIGTPHDYRQKVKVEFE